MLNDRPDFDSSVIDPALLDGAISLTDILQLRAVCHPHRIAYTFLDFGAPNPRSLTYGELNREARQLAFQLHRMELRGERAVLLYPPGLDYIVAFYACLYSGTIAVPAYPPGNNRHMPRLQTIIDDSKAKIILTTGQVANSIRQFAGATESLSDRRWVQTDTLETHDTGLWQVPVLQEKELAFLQYTSGSTGNAKGVMISHGNLMANQQLIQRRFGHDERSTVVGWLPLYHDMGLIGNVMQPLYCGASAVLMSPMAFLEKPLRWLQAINDYRAHTSGGPNFAYDLCVQKISRDELMGIDLSSWQLAFNGAEPINPLTLQRFSEAFTACGFQRRAFYPCYGLAEATLLATGGAKQSLPRIAAFDKAALEQRIVHSIEDNQLNARSLVGCGAIDIDSGQDLRIVDPDNATCCSNGRIGEIWLSGPSIAQGYWQNPEMSDKAFVHDDLGQLWLRTGDLGFIDDGELFVSGRLKDLIIIRGRNYYPHDLEYAVEAATDALSPASTVAFSVDEGDGEKLIVLAELKRNRVRQKDYRNEFSAIRTRLTEECGIQASQILFLKPGAILKTSSGKLRRNACKALFLQQGFECIAVDAQRISDATSLPSAKANQSVNERHLLRQALLSMDRSHAVDLLTEHLALKAAELSGVAAGTVEPTHTLSSLGLDSLKAVEMKYFVDDLLAVDIPITGMLGSASLFDSAVTALSLCKTIDHEASSLSNKDAQDSTTAMSYNQRALWTRARIESGDTLYHMPIALQTPGELDFNALGRALAELHARHAQLRCGFTLDANDEPICVPLELLTPVLERADCSDLARRTETLLNFVNRPFDLQRGPLLRCGVFSCGTNDHLLAFCAHHLIVDFRSLLVLQRELQTLYTGYARDVEAQLPAVKTNYSEYIAWQQSYLQSEAASRDELYWQEQLAGELPRLILPGHFTAPCRQLGHAGAVGLTIETANLVRLKALASAHNVTLYTLVLTVFKTLLYRYTAQHDLIVGTPTLGRPSSRFADVVGYCVNPVALRSKPSGELKFCDYLADVNAVVLGALAHQNYPQSLVLEKLRSEHRQGNIELYRTFFVFQDGSDSDVAALSLGQAGIRLQWAGLEAQSSALPETAEEFELAVLAAETRNGLTVTFRYCRSAWEREGIFRLLGHFQCLLLSMLAEPGTRLSQLSLLTAPERLQQTDWNATEAAYPQDLCLHQLFEAQAEKTPDAVALNFEEQHLTYAELNARANQLAHYLIEQGVGPEVLVGICMERSLDMVIGLLGILKAGGAYVPLDPTYPEERLRYMLDDADIRLLLTRQNWAGLVVSAQRPTVYLDQDWPSINLCLDSNPGVRNLPLNLAYIIYTSGSTGQPKGVAVTHRNAVHSTFARFMQYPDQVKAYLLLSSFAFDSSVAGIFWTLGQGGCLCLPGENAGKDPAALAVLIQHQQVSHLLALPSLYAVLLEQATESLCSLKVAIVAGEACGIELVKQHFVSLPAVKLYNEYGPTEGTVWSSVYQAGLDDLDKPLSIGRPIANVRLCVLDRHLNPLPIGVAGELYIGGAGIVRGYLKRAELTAERFIPDPFQADGGRLYKTGDLARYRSDGALEFLGRIDHQVKIRGFRIELGEIEAQLLAHNKIKEAVVLAREDQPGDKKLVAYLVLSESVVDQHDEVVNLLKVHLKQALPDYMVPSAFVVLDAMPLSANGKLDRQRLPLPNWGGQAVLSYEAPQNPLEMALTQIWQQLLAIERIGRHDNFFALGGDSILSIQVVSRARQAGIVITPKQLFERPTVFELAAIAETASHAVAEQGLVTGPVALTPIQHWFFERGLSNPHHWNQALMLRVKPELTPALFEAALHKLLVQHDALRMRFTNENGEWRQTNLTEEEQNAFEQVDLSHVPVAERDAVLQQQASDCQASLHLTHGPLLRAVWFDIGDNESCIVIAIHHLVVDGVSWRILLEDLNLACQQGLVNQCLNLPTKTTSFQYWAKRLTQLTQNGELNLSTTYWLAPQRTQAATLPVDYPHGANYSGLENEVAVALSAEQTLTLLQEVPIAYRTLIDDVLLTALALTLRDWLVDEELSAVSSAAQTATTTLLIDRESHGREHLTDDLDISRTVGWFTSVYPLLLELPKGDDLALALKTIKEQIRAVPDQGISHGLLRYLSTDAELKQHLIAQPAAQIIFNYLGQLDTVLSEGSLFTPSTDAAGFSYDPAGKRAHELDVVASIQGGRLYLSWRYSRERYRRSTLETLANRYLRHLQALTSQCSQTEVGGYTPSDFPLAALSQSQLDALNLPPRQIDDIYPLVSLQHGLIFHSLYEPDSNVYRIQLACRLTGPLDTSVFKQAWQQLLERHAVLRSRFLTQGGDLPLQIVDKLARLPIFEHDWHNLPEDQLQQHWQQLQEVDQAQGFEFDKAPLMRLSLARANNDVHYLLWSYHHVLLDGWSMPLLIGEVFAMYHALQRGEQAKLPIIKPYRDYIAWLQHQDIVAAERYWRQTLAGFETTTILGVDRAPGNKSTSGGSQKHSLQLTKVETQGLQVFAKCRQLTLNTLAQGAWSLLLSHYSGNPDVVFGITVSGRPAELPGIENQVGLFINTLPMRVQLNPQTRVDDWLQNLFEQNQELRSYEYAPLAKIQTWSDIGRSQALFDSLLVFENYPIDRTLMEIGDSVKIDEVIYIDQTNYPLTLTVFPSERLQLEINYDCQRYTTDVVGEMLTYLRQLLTYLAAQPETKLGNLPTLATVQQKQIILDWNITEVKYLNDSCLHQLFEAQVEQTPNAIALTFEGRHLSYAELNTKANQVAHYLIDRGISPDVLIGLCIERSLEMMIGLLGILKAGGAYVPLDPRYPEDRIRYMMDDACVELLLTQSGLGELIDDGRRQMIFLDRDWPLIAECAEHNAAPRNHPLDLAYIIYTSGSTGQPKGVAVTHRNAVHSTYARFHQYPDPVKAYLLLSSFAFDSSVAGIFWTLGQGGCLCLPGDETGKDPAVLAELIDRQQVSHLLALPSLYRLLLEQPVAQLSSLKAAIVAGEACGIDVVQRHFDALPIVKLYNEYGPTEGTVWSSVYQAGLEDFDRPLAIGRPIANTQLYILDRHLNPVPVGVDGELYIGGAGIVRGYLNRPGLSAERFVPDPFGPAGERLYKTGDLARYRSDGAIEFRGRLDHQVKIRGFRIELGEIEAQLLTLPEIKDAVVLAREDQPGDKRLVAYLVEHQPGTLQLDELKVRLKHILPDYMVPGAFMVLDEMPLSANGKLDRKRLPTLDWNSQSNVEYAAPQTLVETTLTQIWQTLLGVERVGRYDNFFALGGDSILSIQVVSRARQAGIVVTPKQLFEQPTVAGLASVAKTTSRAVAQQGIISGEVALTPIQHWFFERNLNKPQHWNQALLLSVKRELTPVVFEAALCKLLAQHDALRMRFTEIEGQWLQTNLSEEMHKFFDCADLSTIPISQCNDLLQTKACICQASLDLNQGPLLRAVWFEFGGGEQRVLIVIHHLVVDGVSWRILLDDLETACRQGMAGQCLSLPTKTSSFQYWAARLLQLTRNGGLNLNADYWLDPRRKQAQTLPVDESTGANLACLEDEVVITLSGEQTRALLKEVSAAYRTQIDEVLLTALVLALRDWLDGTQSTRASTLLLIDREGHGREHLADDLDVSRTVGWFTSVYPLLLHLDVGDDLGRALKTIKEQIRAVPAHGIGYGLLRYLSDDIELRQTLADLPPARIIFNYLGQLDATQNDDSLFSLASESAGLSYDPTGERPHELDVVGSIVGGCLRLSWRYSRERYQRSTLETLSGRYLQYLKDLIAHCTQAEHGGYTPSDFPLAVLSQAQLDELALAPRQIDDLYPLAPLQHGLMFHSLYEPNSSVYRIQLTCRLTGPLDVEAFLQAWQRLLERHDILRTCFRAEGLDQPLQIVERQVRLPIIEHDWRSLSEAERLQRWQALQAADHRQAYDFRVAPLMRLNLAQTGEDEHYLLWSYHHVLIDGWSMPLLIREVFETYRALRCGENLDMAPTQAYRDYIAWLQTQDMAAAENYWRAQLAGFEAATVLGADLAPGSKVRVSETRTQRLTLTTGASQDLQRLVKQRQLTLNTLVQAAWGLLLSHYSGQRDVVFGITVSGRPAEIADIEQRVGLFINTLPMRVRIDPETSLGDWLQALFQQNLTLRRYEYAPLAQLQTWSEMARGQSLFDTLLVFENYPIDQALMDIAGPLKVDEVVGIEPTNYPLTLTVFPGNCLQMEIHHDSGRFAPDTVAAMLEHLRQLLAAFTEQPHAKLGSLPTLTDAERRQILEVWNTTEVENPQERRIHQLFEAQVEQTPDAVALCFEDKSLTYAELNAKANRLAHYLMAQGVGPDVLVGICIERSLEMVVGLLGILKAGGAYVPMEPNSPRERMAYQLQDTGAKLLVTKTQLTSTLPEAEIAYVGIDSEWPEIEKCSKANPNVTAFASQLAYVIYTSGSTGLPKGVMISHREVLRLFTATERQFRIGSQDVWTMFHSFAFDFSVWEIWGALLYGGRLVIVPQCVSRSPDEFRQLLKQENVTVLNQTPSAFLQLMHTDAQQADGIESLRLVIFGGEALEPYKLKPWFERYSDQLPKLVNMYGITETTVHVTYRVLTMHDVEAAASPVGKPIADLQTYLLNASLNLCPIGCCGELYVGGAGLARGYLNRPELTAERFIPNPFGKPGSRLYKSGDIAKQRGDGELDYLGRIDHQVKIRGFRIELGEIEAQLLAHPEVKAAVVLVREDQPGDKRLVAYLVEDQLGTLVIDELKVQLKQALPDYMVPSAFVVLEEMPLTVNGKLDRKRLPAPDIGEQLGKQYIAPRTETETLLAEIWREVLGVEKVGAEDDFFELGGHSLLATQLASRVAKCFAIDLPLRSVFETGNVATLAEKIDVLLWTTRPETVEAGSLNETDFEEIEF